MHPNHDWIALKPFQDNCYKYVVKKHSKSARCLLCMELWTKQFYFKFFYKLDVWSQSNELNELYLWTVGTSLDDTPVNRKRINYFWTKFRARMNKYTSWEPIFKVTERGSTGRKLHIHFLSVNKITHRVVLRHWRQVVREKANVNFSGYSSVNVNKALFYLTKYLLKDNSRYSWLGPFYKIHIPKLLPSECAHSFRFQYYTQINNWDGLNEEDLEVIFKYE